MRPSPHTASEHRTGDSCASQVPAFESIFGYYPNSKVTDHNAIDLDQRDMEAELSEATPDYVGAKAIYENGGHSKMYATITYNAGASFPAYTKSARCSGTDASGNLVNDMPLKSFLSAGAGSKSVKCIYPTSAVQASYVGCQVGGLPAGAQLTSGCLVIASDITITEAGLATTVMAPSDMSAISQDAGRTLRGFATESTVTTKMYVNSNSCPGCPYTTYTRFYNYYGVYSYANEIVTGALDASTFEFPATPVANYVKSFPFATYSDSQTRKECTKKGTAYLNVWMYVIREFEDAIDDCQLGSIDNNYGSVHAWDEGVAFYTGSLEGTDGSGSGKLLSALADKRCKNYGTCGANGGEVSGTSKVNLDLLTEFYAGRNELFAGRCSSVRPILDRTISLMTIPLVQGALRYAYKMGALGPAGSGVDPAGSSDLLKLNAEGTIFTAAVLPLVASCSSDDAQTIWTQMQLGGGALTTFDKDAVKAAFEANYACLGITCADVGALNAAGGLQAADAATWGVPCTPPSPPPIAQTALVSRCPHHTVHAPVAPHRV